MRFLKNREVIFPKILKIYVTTCTFHYYDVAYLNQIHTLNKDIWRDLQYIPRNMHTVFALLCFVVVIYWLIFPYPSGLLHWHCGNLTIAPVPAKQPWWIWINTSCEFTMNDCITTTKQSTTKPCAYFLWYTVSGRGLSLQDLVQWNFSYRKVSNIRRTKCQNLNVPRLGLQLSLRKI